MKNFNKKSLVLFGIGFFIFLLFLIIVEYFPFNVVSESTRSELKQEVDFKADAIDRFLADAGTDVLFLSQLPNLQTLINSDKIGLKKQSKLNLQNDFLEFSKVKKIYYQIRYINESGQEIVRVDYDGKTHKIISENKLQNKKGRYYFDDATLLDKGIIFTSPLDLNIEHGQLENRGSEGNPIYVPVVRYATSVFDDSGNPKGIIITNVYADFFLKDIQKNSTNGKIFLVNAKGFYLSHQDKDKEFEFMFGKRSSFFKDYPKITRNILANKGETFLETDDLAISFKYIYPAFFQGVSKENYFWVIGVIFPKKENNFFENI